MKKLIFTSACILGCMLVLQACSDDNGSSCAGSNKKADCYQDTYKSSCKDGKAVVCGSINTNFEVFEHNCANCQMVDGKATCGECKAGEVRKAEGGLDICNPAGKWEFVKSYTNHAEENQPCDFATYRPKCDNNVSLECDKLTGRITAVECGQYQQTCVETVEKSEEEYDIYTRQCVSESRRAYCAECKPGEEADNVCITLYSVSTKTVKCSEYGYWIDKETGGVPVSERCDSVCAEGKCAGDFVPCTPSETKDHVCYTNDSFTTDSVTCMTDGSKWADSLEHINLIACPKGCVDDVCNK